MVDKAFKMFGGSLGTVAVFVIALLLIGFPSMATSFCFAMMMGLGVMTMMKLASKSQ